MQYLHLQWFHSEPDYPTDFYFELDDIGWTQRRIDTYENGNAERFIGFHDKAVPSLEELNQPPEFGGKEIDEATFDELWESYSEIEVQDYRFIRGT